MRPQSRKAKGRALQKHVAKRLTDVFDLEEGDVESRSMGAGGVDILLSPKARRSCPISIECKNTRGAPSLSQVKQSEANAYKETIPGVCWKPHGAKYEDTLIIFRLEDLLEWIKQGKLSTPFCTAETKEGKIIKTSESK